MRLQMQLQQMHKEMLTKHRSLPGGIHSVLFMHAETVHRAYTTYSAVLPATDDDCDTCLALLLARSSSDSTSKISPSSSVSSVRASLSRRSGSLLAVGAAAAAAAAAVAAAA
eukprot:17023-Heterococcus_DN1.PRE.2